MIPIFYQDHSILVCQKPAGVLSQPSPACAESMLSLLAEQAGGRVFPVHRLDRGVGGVMVFARTAQAASALSQSIQQKKLVKEYLCVLQGRPAQTEGLYQDLLFQDSGRNKSFVVQRMRKGVKQASLAYRVLDTAGGRSLVWVQLHTGRTHQIRVQFSSRGTPLVGDRKYGGPPGEMGLWSYRLRFPHPADRRPMDFRQPPDGELWYAFHSDLFDLTQAPLP